MLSGSLALAQATRSELIRRPGLLLATAGAGCLLLVLHDLSASAFDATGALARELTHSTIGIALAVVALVSGARSGAAEEELGPTAEVLTTAVGAGRYVFGRFVGICQANAVFLVILLAFATLAFHQAGDRWSSTASWAVGSAWLAAAGYAAIGITLGAALPLPLALILGFAVLIATRLLSPGLADGDGVLALLAFLSPDPGRLDLAREAGFDRALSARSVLLGWGAMAFQATALLAAASALIRRRHR